MAVMIAPTWLPPAGGGATWPGTFEGKYTGPAPHFFWRGLMFAEYIVTLGGC